MVVYVVGIELQLCFVGFYFGGYWQVDFVLVFLFVQYCWLGEVQVVEGYVVVDCVVVGLFGELVGYIVGSQCCWQGIDQDQGQW